MPRVLIRNADLEACVGALDAWVKWLRPGTLAAQLGAVKGALVPFAQGVYYDREALIDDCSVWTTTGEGDQQSKARKTTPHFDGNGVKVGESVVMRDQREFAKRLRELMEQEQTIDVPYLLEQKHIDATASQLVKDTTGLPVVDFAALRVVMKDSAKLATDGAQQP